MSVRNGQCGCRQGRHSGSAADRSGQRGSQLSACHGSSSVQQQAEQHAGRRRCGTRRSDGVKAGGDKSWRSKVTRECGEEREKKELPSRAA